MPILQPTRHCSKEVHTVDALFQDAMLIAVIAVAISLLTILLVIVLVLRQNRLLTRYKLLLSGGTGVNIEELLLEQARQIDQLKSEVSHLSTRLTTLETDARSHLQKSATIRFNAFPDTGSDLSFAIALLDGKDNGVVLSSLYGRSESRIYAKPIQGGKSTYALSDEEKEALAKAAGGQGK